MFGYVTPDTPYLFKKDERLYGALYCGLCKSIGKSCGQLCRTALTYDVAFTSALIHNIRGEDVKLQKKHCLVHWFKKRWIANVDETTLTLACVNTALAYFKLCDDKADGDGKGFLRHLYTRGYKRTLKKHSEVTNIVSRGTKAQSELERAGCDSIDRAAEPSAVMMKELSTYVLKEYSTPETEKLFYAIGKWVYLADALDDYDKDVKKKRYNVLYNIYKKPNLREAVKVGKDELTFVFDMLFADMRESLKGIKFHFNHDLTDNIILRGIPFKTRALIYGENEKYRSDYEQK